MQMGRSRYDMKILHFYFWVLIVPTPFFTFLIAFVYFSNRLAHSRLSSVWRPPFRFLHFPKIWPTIRGTPICAIVHFCAGIYPVFRLSLVSTILSIFQIGWPFDSSISLYISHRSEQTVHLCIVQLHLSPNPDRVEMLAHNMFAHGTFSDVPTIANPTSYISCWVFCSWFLLRHFFLIIFIIIIPFFRVYIFWEKTPRGGKLIICPNCFNNCFTFSWSLLFFADCFRSLLRSEVRSKY